MWTQVGLGGGAAVLLIMVLWGFGRRRSNRRPIDVGPVSESWLAEQRRRNDNPY